MRRITTTLFITLVSTGLHAQIVNFEWAAQMGGTSDEYGQAITSDAAGNVYTTGSFQGIADFDPGTPVLNLTPKTIGADDIFISKLDASGNLVWVRQIGGIYTDVGWSIGVDGAGCVYTTGGFQGTVDFDPGADSFKLTAPAQSAMFLCKLNASGNFVWAKSFGGSTAQNDGTVARALALDNAANIYVTGHFESTVNFVSSTLTSLGPAPNIFVCKFDSSGTTIWAKGFLNSISFLVNSNDGLGIAVDGSGNVYTTGPFEGSVDFNPGTGSATLPQEGIFVSKLDASGGFVWVKRLPSVDYYGASHIAVDNAGNSFIAGNFAGMGVDFNPGNGTAYLSSSGPADVFMVKLDASGNFGWAKKMGGSGFDAVSSISLDQFNGVYTTGRFAATADFNPGSGQANLSSAGGDDIFISRLDIYGNYSWAKKMGGSSDDAGRGINVGATGNVYTTGSFQTTSDFDPGANQSNLTSFGSNDIYVHKLSQVAVGIDENNAPIGFGLYPNPTAGDFFIRADKVFTSAEVEITNIAGQVVFQKSFVNVSTFHIQMEVPQGLYFVAVKNNKGEKTVMKLVKE